MPKQIPNTGCFNEQIISSNLSSRKYSIALLASPTPGKITASADLIIVASEVIMNESEWKDQYDREELEKLGFLEEQLETLLGEHLKSIGDGPAGQESN